MDFSVVSRGDLILIINKLAEKLGDEVTKTVEEILKTSQNISAVRVEVAMECFFLEMDKKAFRILEKVLNNGKDVYLGACCGQTKCYVCERYGGIIINRKTLRLKFFDKANPDDLQRYTSEISSEIEEYFNDWINKYLDSRDQSVRSNSKVDDEEEDNDEEDNGEEDNDEKDNDEGNNDEEDIDEEEDAEEEEVIDKVTKKVKK